MARGWHLSLEQKIDRFLSKINVTPTCWLWTGYLNAGGYGRYHWHGDVRRNWLAHRLMWQLCFGDLDPNLKVCHTCDNPRCVNPEHLWLGTQVDNIQDAIQKGRHKPGAKRGSQNLLAKLTEEQVAQIKALATTGGTQVALGQQFGVSHVTIGRIIHSKTWKHVN